MPLLSFVDLPQVTEPSLNEKSVGEIPPVTSQDMVSDAFPTSVHVSATVISEVLVGNKVC